MDSHEISVQPDAERCGHIFARVMADVGGKRAYRKTHVAPFPGKERLPAPQYTGKCRFEVRGIRQVDACAGNTTGITGRWSEISGRVVNRTGESRQYYGNCRFYPSINRRAGPMHRGLPTILRELPVYSSMNG